MPRLFPAQPRLMQPSQAAVRRGGGLVTLALIATLATTVQAQTSTPQTPPVAAPTPAGAAAAPTVSGGRIVRPTLRLGSQGESVRELQSMLVLLGFYPGPVSGVYQEDTQGAVQRFQQAASITADGIVGPATWSKLFPAPAAEATPPGQAGTSPAPSTSSRPPATPTPTPAPTPTPSSTPAPANPPAAQPTPTTPPASGTSPNATSTSATLPILRPGMEGDAVRFLQQRLTAKRLYTGPIDGIFGSQTETAVRQLQRTNNLTVDGIVGPATWRALN